MVTINNPYLKKQGFRPGSTTVGIGAAAHESNVHLQGGYAEVKGADRNAIQIPPQKAAELPHAAKAPEKKVAPAPSPIDTPNAFDRAVNVANAPVTVANLATVGMDFFLPIIGGIASLPVRLIGGKEKAKNFRDKINSPSRYMQDHTIGDVAAKMNVKAPERVAGTSLSSATMNFAFLGADAIETIHTTRTFQRDSKHFAEMVADVMELDKAPSATQAMRMHVPPALASIRADIMKSYGINMGTHALTTGMDLLQAFRGKGVHMGLFMASQAIGMGVRTYVGGNETLPAYLQFSQAFKSGQPLQQVDYANFINAAVKECRDLRDGASNPVVQALAAQFAAEKASPAQILRESGLKEGGIKARIEAITSEYDAKHNLPHNAPANATSFAERVNGAKQPAGPVFGQHTKAVAENTQAAGHARAGGV